MRVLVARAGALGDLVLLRRTIALLRRGGHAVALLAPSGPASALVGNGAADVAEALPWESAAYAPLFADGAAPGTERLRGFDAALAYTRDATLARGVRAIVPRVAVHDPAPPETGPHASEWLARALAGIGVPATPIEVPVLAPGPAEAQAAAPVLARLPPGFVAIHPGSGSRRKNWPADRFAALARGLGGTPWLLVRGPADDEPASVLEAVPGAVAARDLPPRALAAVLGRAGAYVGNDSGVTHLAAATGAPTVALFGATDPAIWAPIGPRVRIVGCGSAMDAVTVEDVRAALAGWRRA